jgi:acyl-CoA thioester hydrolase
MKSSASPDRFFTSEMNLVVRMYDIDYNGHVSNIVYMRWFEDMRTVAFEKIASLKECLDKGFAPVLVSVNIQYKRPIKMFDQPKGLLWITKFGKTSFTLQAEISIDETLCTASEQTVVFINTKTNRPCRLPDQIVHNFQKANVPGPLPKTL